MRRASPRPLARALERVVASAAPATLLGRAQRVWAIAAPAAIAAHSEPISERDGWVTIGCQSSVWASELSLMEGELTARLNGQLAAAGELGPVAGLRFVTQSAGGSSPRGRR